MNAWMQIAIVSGICFLALLAIMLVRKCPSFGRIAALVIVGLITAVTLYQGVEQASRRTSSRKKNVEVADSSSFDRYLAYTYAQQGNYTQAQLLLNTLMQEGDTEDDLLFQARLYALQGDYESAVLCYAKYLADQDVDFQTEEVPERVQPVFEEMQLATALRAAAFSDIENGVIAQLAQEAGQSVQEYLGLTESLGDSIEISANDLSSLLLANGKALSEDEREGAIHELTAGIQKQLEKKIDDMEVSKNAETVYECIQTIQEQYIAEQTGAYVDEESIKEQVEELAKLANKDDNIAASDEVRDALLKGYVMVDDAAGIAANIDENATVNELITAIDLYAEGKIVAEDFSAIESISTDKINTIVERLNKIVDEHSDELTAVEKKQIKEIVEVVTSGNDRQIVQIISNLVDAIENGNAEDISKAYLEVAKGYNSIAASNKASEYVDAAFETYNQSTDPAFNEAMDALGSIIAGDDSHSVTSISGYVDTAVSNLNEIDTSRVSETEAAIKAAEEARIEAEKRAEEEARKAEEEAQRLREQQQREYEEAMREWEASQNRPDDYEDGNSQGGFFFENQNTTEAPAHDYDDYDTAGSSSIRNKKEKNTNREDVLPFEDYLTNNVSQKRATINIGQIDITGFPTVKARVAFSDTANITEQNIGDKILLTDCQREIDSFKAEQLKQTYGKIILVCDMSGSMSGSDGELREAVRGFADGMSANEQIAVVGFSSSIVFSSPFLSSASEVKAYADRIYASGGTSIYPTIMEMMNMYNNDVNANNIMIVMTDGQDGNRGSDYDLNETLAAAVAQNNVTIYTVGLGGGVDTGYLEQIAGIGNGQFLYVDSAESLNSFYDFIHTQVANQFIVTFDALDTALNNRELNISLTDGVGNATKKYSLVHDAGDQNPDANNNTPGIVSTPAGLSISNLSSSLIYVSDKDQELKVYGTGFKKDVDYKVSLKGTMKNYAINYTYENETTLKITVPYTIPVATYELSLSGEGESAKKSNALTVAAPGSMDHLQFGAYSFTCDSISTSGSRAVLHGNVILNGWLHFKGDVTIDGDYISGNSEYVTMSTADKAYIQYSKNGSTGLAKVLANNGWTVSMPCFGSITLYGDSYSSKKYEDFRVDSFILDGIDFKNACSVGGTFALYPDMVLTTAFYGDMNFAYFSKFVPSWNTAQYTKEATGKIAMTSNNIAGAVELSFTYNTYNTGGEGFCFNMLKLPVRVKKFAADLDFISNNYSVETDIWLQAAKAVGLKGIGLKLAWADGKFDQFKLYADVKVPLTETPIPIFLNKVGIEAKGMSKGSGGWDTIKKTTITGSFKLVTNSLTDFVPQKVNDLLDLRTIYLAELDDAHISLRLEEFNLNFGAKLKMLGIQLAEAQINIGKFSYNNKLMNISEDEAGVDIALSAGLMDLGWKNLYANVTGTKELTLGYPFSGFLSDGTVDYGIQWGWFDWGKSLYGGASIGVFKNSRDEVQFSVVVKGTKDANSGKYKGFRWDASKSMGVQKTNY